MSAAVFEYVGRELPLFDKASNWKAYWRSRIAAFVHGDVLEVGAGIGANTRALAGLEFESWTALEPDAGLAEQIELPSERHRREVGTLEGVTRQFDSILYIDVLEHIDDDREELRRAAARLKPGGSLIVLAPAHPFLYSPFDAAVGHYRRYTRASLRAVGPEGLRLARLEHLDAAGMLVSAANRMLLHSPHPTEAQVIAWDRVLVPISRAMDPLFAGRIGKSVVAVWQA